MTFLGKARSEKWLTADGVNARSIACASYPHMAEVCKPQSCCASFIRTLRQMGSQDSGKQLIHGLLLSSDVGTSK